MIKRLYTSFVDSCDLNYVVMIDLFASDLLNASVWIKSQLYSLKLEKLALGYTIGTLSKLKLDLIYVTLFHRHNSLCLTCTCNSSLEITAVI